jgi:hypothetical protein
MGGFGVDQLAQNKDQMRAPANATLNIQVPQNKAILLIITATISFSINLSGEVS